MYIFSIVVLLVYFCLLVYHFLLVFVVILSSMIICKQVRLLHFFVFVTFVYNLQKKSDVKAIHPYWIRHKRT